MVRLNVRELSNKRNVMLKNNRKSDIYAWNKKLSVDGELIAEYGKTF